jgi:ABC-type branched-subunit amino acid transport system substrate-binding protein
MALATLTTTLGFPAYAQTAISDVYIEQTHGLVSPGVKVPAKPVPEAAGVVIQNTGPTAPTTCNAQNASSQACYTATQQARPASR